MHYAYNAYVSRVLEEMVGSDWPLNEAKRACRSNLQFLEQAYVSLTDTKAVASEIMAS